MPWWMGFVFLAAGWRFKILYDWKINPAITNSQKKQERKEVEEKKRRKKKGKKKLITSIGHGKMTEKYSKAWNNHSKSSIK